MTTNYRFIVSGSFDVFDHLEVDALVERPGDTAQVELDGGNVAELDLVDVTDHAEAGVGAVVDHGLDSEDHGVAVDRRRLAAGEEAEELARVEAHAALEGDAGLALLDQEAENSAGELLVGDAEGLGEDALVEPHSIEVRVLGLLVVLGDEVVNHLGGLGFGCDYFCFFLSHCVPLRLGVVWKTYRINPHSVNITLFEINIRLPNKYITIYSAVVFSPGTCQEIALEKFRWD